MLKIISCTLILFLTAVTVAQPIKVTVSQTPAGEWQLLRGGEPYYIKGAGGDTNLDKLIEIGGNSIRTWGTDNAKEILDEAHAKGLTVMLGLWVPQERQGFDYDDADKVAAVVEGFRKAIMELKDHPALLLWGVGNEVDLAYTNTKVWDVINDIATIIHDVDPNHPTCTVTAGLDKEEVRLIMERAPAIDIYGVNTYGDIGNVKKNIANFGWKGPYIISEWGPNGHWEVERSKWGASIEQTSSQKADSYEERYIDYIAADKAQCIGSYVFLWGHKQETTATWYGLFSEDGASAEALDRLQKIWTGKPPINSCPHLDSLIIEGFTDKKSILLIAEEKYAAAVAVSDPDDDKLSFKWLIIPESTDIRSGGDAEKAPQAISGLFLKKNGKQATFRAPSEEGAYRLFIFVYDGKKHYAYANQTFYVTPRDPEMGQGKFITFKKMDGF
ncbi:MAG: hypothetical protein IPG01_12650 [Chitinophagaceae bacterium]|nr:hypothetical protein [Chitinophagaceae bacterium]